jgi:spore coat protein H
MRCFVTSILIFLGVAAHAQNGMKVFNDTIVHELVIETDLVSWFDTLEKDFDQNFKDPTNYPEIYRKCKISFDGIELENCGFREKGNASNGLTNFGKKKPFKISMNEFVDQALDGLKKLNLNNFTNDPSLLHDAICFKLFRDEGLIASRTSFTRLTINGEYIGLYVVIENVDKTFLKRHFGSKGNDGNLYKTDRGAKVPLTWEGTESGGYKDQGLKLNTNEDKDDWSKLISFIDLINNDHSPDFKHKLDSSFDVHAYLKILAIEKCVRSWDSYWGGGNNYYIYEHPDGKLRWIPWDMNESFQDIKALSGTSIFDGYLLPANKFDERPLLKRIFEFEEYKNEYLDYVCELIHSSFTLDHLGPYILERHDLIANAYASDPFRYNTYSSFESSITNDNQDVVSPNHGSFMVRVTYPGLLPFIQSQREWAVEQMKGWDRDCSVRNNTTYDLSIYPNPATEQVNIVNDPLSPFEYAQFRLFDYSGKLYFSTPYQVMSGYATALDLRGVPAGLYLLMKCSGDGRVGRGKLVVY